MQETFPLPDKPFATPQEEIAYLREHIARRERDLASRGATKLERVAEAAATVRSYGQQAPGDVLEAPFVLKAHEAHTIKLRLDPERHDGKIEELLSYLPARGIRNVLTVLERFNNPHLEDDFHRALVQWIHEGLPIKGREGAKLWRALHMTLYEVLLPHVAKKEEGGERPFKELVSAMGQFYQGLLSTATKLGKVHFSIELAVPEGSEEVGFYVSVPTEYRDLFEKQMLAIYPDAKIREHTNDYNIFSDNGAAAGSFAAFARRGIFPLKTFEEFDYDPLNVLLNSFSKVARTGEGAALQLVVSPAGDFFMSAFEKALRRISKGMDIEHATDIHYGRAGKFFAWVKREFFAHKRKKEEPLTHLEELFVENIKGKIGSPIAGGNLRLVVSAQTHARASALLSELEAALSQFEKTQGNKLLFRRVKKSRLREFFRAFSFRTWELREMIPLSVKELTTLIHFPPKGITSTPEFKQSKAATAAAPLDMPETGIYLGLNKHRNRESAVYMTPEDRLRHFYVVGQTGTGKSTLLKNLIIQDIKNGEGICFIDPHGVDILDIIANIPKERYEDVMYFDPAYLPRPMGLNMLEYDPRFPEQKTFVINELLSIFRKLYGAVPEALGPAFEQYFRNSTMLVMDHPESGNTLFEIARVFNDPEFRRLKLSHSKNPTIIQFWENAERTQGEQSLSNFSGYITSKFDTFTTNEYMRPIVGQEKSSFNFRDIMDGKKIFLVNLSKGRLGDLNANLLGLVIVGKFLMAALSRVDSLGKDLPPFYLYIDEFQNVTTDSIATILSEARKYRLSLTVAHQFIKQLREDIRDAVFGNVGSLCAFRVGAEDAEFLQKQFAPTFAASDLINVENLKAYVRLLIRNKPATPFNIDIAFASKGNPGIVDSLKELSYLTYGRDREEVESFILTKYHGA